MPNLRRSLLFAAIALLLTSSTLPAQSLHVESPAPLRSGINHATIDSFGGSHFWFVMLQPGNFRVVWSFGSSQEGFQVGSKPAAGAAFAPKTVGAVINSRDTPNGASWTGSVTRPTRLMIEVDPAKSALVRQTTAYTLEASGSVSYAPGATPGAAPSVVGVYAVKGGTSDHGVAKFTADGEIATTTGENGRWKLFDAESRVYTVTIGRDRWSLIYQPGRGFIDAGNQNLVLEQRH